MEIDVFMPRSFKKYAGENDLIIRTVKANKINDHYLFKLPIIFIPGGRGNLWHIAKVDDKVAYKFFRTKKQAVNYIKEVE